VCGPGWLIVARIAPPANGRATQPGAQPDKPVPSAATTTTVIAFIEVPLKIAEGRYHFALWLSNRVVNGLEDTCQASLT
jgi:hypothetical protein